MVSEIGKQAKVILAGGERLAHEIEEAIRDIVISNAAGIERFHERREELTKVDHRFLFFYAVSLVLFFAFTRLLSSGSLSPVVRKRIARTVSSAALSMMLLISSSVQLPAPDRQATPRCVRECPEQLQSSRRDQQREGRQQSGLHADTHVS
jgi:hypothetical protein